jgi:hypothetical protein
MEAREISAEQWVSFVKEFSHLHQGEPVTIEVLDPQQGPQHIVEDAPLMGLSFDTAGSRPSSLEIAVGDRPESYVRHVIDLPMTIRVASGGERAGDVALQIEQARGPVTLVLIKGPFH